MIESAGILLFRRRSGLEIFLIHMGGPLWARRDEGAWSLPKGMIGRSEDPLQAARREFQEETGFRLDGAFEPLGTFRQNSGKNLTVWALEGDCDPDKLVSNHFSMIWPPRSGRRREFPEADRGGWFGRTAASEKIVKGQQKILDKFFALQAKQRPE